MSLVRSFVSLDRKRVAAGGLAFLVVVWMLVVSAVFRVDLLNTDTAQYVSSARNLLRGEGYVTDLLYFEEQRAWGRIPAPQTVWPPAYPALIAIGLALGVDAAHAAFLVALVSAGAVPWFLYATMRRTGSPPWLVVALIVPWLITAWPAITVLRGLSEATFTVITMAGCYSLLRAASDRKQCSRWMVAAGCCAALAFLVRYAGLTYIAATSVTLIILRIRDRDRSLLPATIGAISIPVVVVAAILVRNAVLAGTLVGGPEVSSNESIIAVVKSTYWAGMHLLGLSGSAEGAMLRLPLLLATTWSVAEALRRISHDKHQRPGLEPLQQTLLVICSTYIAVTVLLLDYMAYKREASLVSGRYFVPLLPFGLLLLGVVVDWARRSIVRPFGARLIVAVSVSSALFIVVQVLSVTAWSHSLSRDYKYSLIQEAMSQLVLDETVGERIRRMTESGGAVLDLDGQLLGMLLDRPVVGLTARQWTTRRWGEKEVLELVETFDVKVVTVFPAIVSDVVRDSPDHQAFYGALQEGRVPAWLELAMDTPSVKVYETIQEVR